MRDVGHREQVETLGEKAHDGVVKTTPEAVAGRGGHVGAPDPHAGTRRRVARSILENGPSTAAVLGRRLGLTSAAVRRHLDALVADGIIEGREQRVFGQRGRGRPAKVFTLTATGRDEFEQAYDDLAVGALRFLADTGGPELVGAFVRTRLADLEERYRTVVTSAPAEDQATALAEVLTADGYAASAESSPLAEGEQICQHHCPVAHVAEQFPQLCEAETELFSRLLGTHVQRIATIAHGDGVCTTHVPRRGAARSVARN